MGQTENTGLSGGDDILSEAHRLIRGERLRHYGPPIENFTRIAQGWTAYLGNRLGNALTVNDVCAMMVILKQMRMAEGYHRDSATDTAGYAALQEILDEGVNLNAS